MKPIILAGVYNPISYDGRVQRACVALSEIANVELVCPIGPNPPKGLPFKVHTIPLPKDKGTKLKKHLAFWLAFIRIAMKLKPKLIHAHDYFMAFPGFVASWLSGSRLVYDAHELIIPEPGKSMNPRMYFWYLLERAIVNRADFVIAANKDRAHLMQRHYDLNIIPIVIQNISPKWDNIICESELITRYPTLSRKFPNERLLIYQGDVSLCRGIDRFLRALIYLPDNYRLIVVGGGPDLEKLISMAEPFERTGRFVALGRVDNKFLPFILQLADLGIITYSFEGLNNIYCAPNKIFEYAQAGLPMVSTDQLPLCKLIKRYYIGELIGKKDGPEDIALCIFKLIEKISLYKRNLKKFLVAHRWEDEILKLQKNIIALINTT